MSRFRRLFGALAFPIFVVVVMPAAVAAAQPDIAGPPATTTIGMRRISGALALIPAALLYLLYRALPRPYIRAWVAMWLGLALPLFIGSMSTGPVNFGDDEWRTVRLNIARLSIAIAALTWMGGLTLLGLSASWIRSPMRWPRWLLPAGLAVAGWFLIGSVTIGLRAVTQGALVLGAIVFALDAIAFLRLARNERLVGALIIGVVMAIIPIDMVVTGVTGLTRTAGPAAIWVWTLVYALLALGMHLLVFEDVTWELRQLNTELRSAQSELKARAVTDELTGCFNRRFFDEIAPHELKRHQRYRRPLSLLFFDCDRFKQINDTRGHAVGDRVLETIGRVLRGHVRETDYVFRWGGDEFLAIITCDEVHAALKADEMTGAFAAEPILRELPPGVGLSVGAVTVPPDATELLTYVQLADARMYEMKQKSA